MKSVAVVVGGQQWLRSRETLVLGAALSIATGVCLGMYPATTILTFGFAAAVTGILLSPTVRLVFLVFVGLITLGSTQNLSAAKVGYLLGVALIVSLAISHRRIIDKTVREHMKPLTSAAIGLMSILTVSLCVAIVSNIAVSAWLRAAAPFLLLMVSPLLVMEIATSSVSIKTLRAVFVVAGLASAVSFAVAWMARRNIGAIPIDQLVLPSGAFASAFVCFAVSSAYYGASRRQLWLVFAAIGVGCLLITGTRSALFVVLSVPAVVLAERKLTLARMARAAIVFLGGLTLALLAIQALSVVAGVDLGHVTERLLSIQNINNESSAAAQSLVDRRNQSSIAWAEFISHPVFGVGPGHMFNWRDSFGNLQSSTSLDSPLGYLAQFGLLGVAALVAFAWAVTHVLRRRRNSTEVTIARGALVGYGILWVLYLPLGLPFEDKGFALSAILLLAMYVRAINVAAGRDVRRLEPLRPSS